MKRRTCFYAVCAALITLLCVLITFFIPVFAADHDCTGEDCAVCAVISVCKTLTVSSAAAVIFAFSSVIGSAAVGSGAAKFAANRSPVSLKVKLLS